MGLIYPFWPLNQHKSFSWGSTLTSEYEVNYQLVVDMQHKEYRLVENIVLFHIKYRITIAFTNNQSKSVLFNVLGIHATIVCWRLPGSNHLAIGMCAMSTLNSLDLL